MDAIKAVVKDVAGDPVFLLVSIVAVGGAVLMVTRRNPVYAALWLMQCFIAVAVVFLKLNATFLAAVHVLVYTGAILVLFLFVIMLLNLAPRELGQEHSKPAKLLAAGVCAGLLVLLAAAFLRGPADGGTFKELAQVSVQVGDKSVSIPPGDWGGVRHVGAVVFDRFVVSFEVVSVLIVVAILGAVVLAKRKL